MVNVQDGMDIKEARTREETSVTNMEGKSTKRSKQTELKKPPQPPMAVQPGVSSSLSFALQQSVDASSNILMEGQLEVWDNDNSSTVQFTKADDNDDEL